MIERSLRIDSQRLERHLPHSRSILRVDIRNGKLWIQHNGKEDGVTSQLVAAGSAREQIALAFKSSEASHLTYYAVV